MADVVTCLLVNDEQELLILKRSDKVRTYKGCWGGVAGYIEEDEGSLDTAYKEISEEVGLRKIEVKLLKVGKIVEFKDVDEGKEYSWVVHPFLFRVDKKSKINIDWEHSEFRWIKPPQIKSFNTVPFFKEIVFKMLD